jgi:hypothetical protein
MDVRRRQPAPEPHPTHRSALDARAPDLLQRQPAPTPQVPAERHDNQHSEPEDLEKASGAAGRAGLLRRDRYAIQASDELDLTPAEREELAALQRATIAKYS